MAVTRWREDATRDAWGTFCYLRDVDKRQSLVDGAFSPTAQPSDDVTRPSSPKARAEFRRRDEDIETHTEIVVSPEDDIELRRMRITNLARRARTIERRRATPKWCSRPPASDALHPAFGNLFVQTEIVDGRAGDPVHTPAPRARASRRPGCSI